MAQQFYSLFRSKCIEDLSSRKDSQRGGSYAHGTEECGIDLFIKRRNGAWEFWVQAYISFSVPIKMEQNRLNKTTDYNQDKSLFLILTIISHFMPGYNYEYSPHRWNAIKQ